MRPARSRSLLLPCLIGVLSCALLPRPAAAEVRAPLWRVSVGETPLVGPVEVGEEYVLVGERDGGLLVVEPVTGRILTQNKLGDPVDELLGDDQGEVTGITVGGSLVHFLPTGAVDGDPECLPAPVHGRGSLSGKLLVLPLVDATVLAYSTETRSPLWRASLGALASAPPALSALRVAVTTELPSVELLSAATGASYASTRLEQLIETAPAWAGNCLLLGAPGTKLLGLDGKSGKVRFRADVGRGPAADLVGRGNRALVATLSNQLVLLKADGNPQWVAGLPGRVVKTPVVRGARVLAVPHLSGTLAAFDRATGLPAFVLELPDPLEVITSPPVLALGSYIVATSTGALVSLGGPGAAIAVGPGTGGLSLLSSKKKKPAARF